MSTTTSRISLTRVTLFLSIIHILEIIAWVVLHRRRFVRLSGSVVRVKPDGWQWHDAFPPQKRNQDSGDEAEYKKQNGGVLGITHFDLMKLMLLSSSSITTFSTRPARYACSISRLTRRDDLRLIFHTAKRELPFNKINVAVKNKIPNGRNESIIGCVPSHADAEYTRHTTTA